MSLSSMSKQVKKQSIPFWSWNGKLEKEELLRQIDRMHEEGYGGFIMHARSGLLTEYMSKEWLDMIGLCAERAKELGLEPWLYDENGWPSGFVGGELLKDEKNRENYLEESFGAYDENAFLSYNLSFEELKPAKAGDTNCLNIYVRTSVETVDILDPDVVDRFIEETHEKYKQALGGELRNKVAGFFTDEPQYFSHGTPFPHIIKQAFWERYKEELYPGLGLLFVEKKGYREFRYKYRSTLQALFLDNFAKKLDGYCKEQGVCLTGHYCEERDLFAQLLFCGGIMPFYEHMGQPGIDWLCRRFMTIVPPVQLGSVARQLGKEDTLSESYGMTGWDTTPTELKAIAEFQMMYGVTRICQHLIPYSENGYRKYDYPAHFTPLNPWTVRGMSELNGYFDILSAFFKEHPQKVRIAVLHPIRTAYMYYKNRDEKSTAHLDKGFLDFCTELAEDHVAFHFLDETIFARHGRICGDKLLCGEMEYDLLVIPPQCETMDGSTESFLRAYVKNGGKVWVVGEPPKYLEGEPYSFDYLSSNVTEVDLIKSNDYQIASNTGNVYSSYRVGKDGEYVFLLNADFKRESVVKCFARGSKEFCFYDISTGQTMEKADEIHLPPCGSVILKKSEKTTSISVEEKPCVEICFPGMKIEKTQVNSLVLDKARYSLDGVNFSERMPVCGIFYTLMDKKHVGNVYLKYSFTTKILPKSVYLRCDKHQYRHALINNVAVAFNELNTDEEIVDIAPYVRLGENVIIMIAEFSQNEEVYKAIDSPAEGLINKIVYDKWFDGVSIVGDFGVFAKKSERGFSDQSVLMDDFYLDEPKKRVSDFVSDGYPFFSGIVELSGTVTLPSKKAKLRLNGRNYFVEAYLNGNFAGKFFFNREIDVSKVAKKGRNELKLVVYTSARNLYGPHHVKDETDGFWVTPTSFTFLRQWHGGKCENYREEYSLLKW